MITLRPHSTGKTEMETTMILLALADGMGVRTYHGPAIDLDSIEQDFTTEPEQAAEQLFIPKESAYERRNRGAKWYRRFEKRRN